MFDFDGEADESSFKPSNPASLSERDEVLPLIFPSKSELSPFINAYWSGVAPLYFGSFEGWTFNPIFLLKKEAEEIEEEISLEKIDEEMMTIDDFLDDIQE